MMWGRLWPRLMFWRSSESHGNWVYAYLGIRTSWQTGKKLNWDSTWAGVGSQSRGIYPWVPQDLADYGHDEHETIEKIHNLLFFLFYFRLLCCFSSKYNTMHGMHITRNICSWAPLTWDSKLLANNWNFIARMKTIRNKFELFLKLCISSKIATKPMCRLCWFDNIQVNWFQSVLSVSVDLMSE